MMKSTELAVVFGLGALLGGGVVSSVRQPAEPPPADELRVVYYDPEAGRAVEGLATEVDVSSDGTVRLWYGSGRKPADLKSKGIVVIRPNKVGEGE